jgi:hypothetical protein
MIFDAKPPRREFPWVMVSILAVLVLILLRMLYTVPRG